MPVPYTRDLMEGEIKAYGSGWPVLTVLLMVFSCMGKVGRSSSENTVPLNGILTIFLGGNHRTDWLTTYPFLALLTRGPRRSAYKGIRSATATCVSAMTYGLEQIPPSCQALLLEMAP